MTTYESLLIIMDERRSIIRGLLEFFMRFDLRGSLALPSDVEIQAGDFEWSREAMAFARGYISSLYTSVVNITPNSHQQNINIISQHDKAPRRIELRSFSIYRSYLRYFSYESPISLHHRVRGMKNQIIRLRLICENSRRRRIARNHALLVSRNRLKRYYDPDEDLHTPLPEELKRACHRLVI